VLLENLDFVDEIFELLLVVGVDYSQMMKEQWLVDLLAAVEIHSLEDRDHQGQTDEADLGGTFQQRAHEVGEIVIAGPLGIGDGHKQFEEVG
jgi:hypothetical protein